jgi:hypothetical protein
MSQNQQGQQQMTVQDAAGTLQFVIQEKTIMNGKELDAARAALGFLVNNFVLLDRVAVALKAAATKAGVDVNAIITAVQSGQPVPQVATSEPPTTRAEKRRGKLAHAAPKKDAAQANGADTQE